MKLQELIIWLIFAAALFYMGRRIYLNLRKPHTGDGCEACGTKERERSR